MMVYLLLMIAFGILIIVAVGLLIFGLLRKRKNSLIMAAVLFLIGVAGGAFSAFTYTKKAIGYVRSKEFQNDTQKGAALAGQTMGSAALGMADGLSKTLDDEAINKLAGKSATIFGKAIKTVASGLDSTIGNKNIYLDKTLENSGIDLGSAAEEYNTKTNDLGINIDYLKDFEGTLRVTNYDQNGRKIEVADKEIHAKKGQNKVEVFSFFHANLGITTYYIVSKAE